MWECFAGVTFAFELLLSWNVAFVATHNLRKRIVLKRSKIAQFYVWHSTFIFDFISTMVFVVQVRTYVAHKAAFFNDLLVLMLESICCLCPCALDDTRSSCNLSLIPMHHHYVQHVSAQHCQAANKLRSSSGSTPLAFHHALTCRSF